MLDLTVFLKLKTPDPARRDENRMKSDDEKVKVARDKYQAQEDAFQAQLRAEEMVSRWISQPHCTQMRIGRGCGVIAFNHSLSEAHVSPL